MNEHRSDARKLRPDTAMEVEPSRRLRRSRAFMNKDEVKKEEVMDEREKVGRVVCG